MTTKKDKKKIKQEKQEVIPPFEPCTDPKLNFIRRHLGNSLYYRDLRDRSRITLPDLKLGDPKDYDKKFG